MFAAAHEGEAGSAVSFQQHPAMLQPKPWWHLTVRAEWWGEEMSVMKLRNGAGKCGRVAAPGDSERQGPLRSLPLSSWQRRPGAHFNSLKVSPSLVSESLYSVGPLLLSDHFLVP